MHMSNLKSILSIASLLALLALAAISSNSCKNSTTSTNPVDDTIHLVSNAQTITFRSDSTADSIQLWLSCGCKFSLITSGSGGDVSRFTVQSRTPDTAWTTPHYLRFQYQSQLGVAKDSAWFAFSALDHFGNTKYDTLIAIVN